MRILLIQPATNWHHPYCETPSVALHTLGAIAKAKGHKITIAYLDIDEEPDYGDYDMVGLTVNTFQVKDARRIAAKIADVSDDIKIVIGGPHAIAWENEVDGSVDHIVIGEGENEWLQILGCLPSIKTIDDVPWPDYSLVDMSRFCGVQPVGAYPSLAIIASRGCPNECIFCNTPAFWGKKVRYRNPESVVEQIEKLNTDYGIREIFFQDDTFNLNHKWAMKIFEGIIAKGLNKKMLFKICCRVNENLITREFLDMAFRASVWNIFYGIESGSQEMLDRMKKRATVEDAHRAIRMTREAHIQSQCSFVVGLPGETRHTLNQTAQFIRDAHPDSYGWCFACPFPGTEFERMVKEKGHWRELDYSE